jgi:transposase-like protein
MRRCFLDNIPQKHNKYNWEESIGLAVPFEYDGVKDEFIIVKYESRDKVYVQYHNKEYMLYGKYIKQGKIAKIFGKSIEWHYSIGDVIKDHIKSHDRHLLIKNRKYIDINKNPNYRQHKYYQYKCLICGYDCAMDGSWVNEANLKVGHGCGCCAGTKIVVGINDISTTYPQMLLYLDDINYAYTHTKTSQKITDMTCPICGFKKRTSADKLYYQSFGCPKCSDGYSYPEKFLINVLEQLSVLFKYQLNKKDMNWCGKYKYDFYLPEYNCIIETNGKQHYDKGWGKYERQHKTDIIKKNLALENGIELYIELDCSESDKDYIKQSIINSNLPFDVSNIDYNLADMAAQKNILIEVCRMYAEYPDYTIKKIAELYRIDKNTVVRYLRKGRELGLCEYRDERRSKGKEKLKKMRPKAS